MQSVIDLFPDKHIHHYDVCNFNMCANISKSETENQAKKSYKFQHSWIQKKSLSFCEKTSVWWAIYSEGEGLFCYLCRKHDMMNTQNKSKIFNENSPGSIY